MSETDELIKQVREGGDPDQVLEDILQEAKKDLVLDTDSFSDRESVEKILRSRKLDYKTKGSVVHVDVERDSLRASSLLLKLDRMKIRFNDISQLS